MKRTDCMFAGAGAAVVLSSIGVGRRRNDTSQRRELQPVERFMTSFMAKYDVPRGQSAVAKDGRLVYARGFGYADRERKTVVSPNARLRIAGCTKPVTVVAIMKLVARFP